MHGQPSQTDNLLADAAAWNCSTDGARIDSAVALLSLDRSHPPAAEVSIETMRVVAPEHGTVEVTVMTGRRHFLRVERLESRALPAVTIAVNAALDQHAINPLIYGTAFATTAQLADLNSPYNRSGGNA